MSASVDQIASDIAMVLREPNLTSLESEAIATVILKKRARLANVRAALVLVYAELPPDCFQFSSLVLWLECFVGKTRKPVSIERPPAWEGAPSNVIRIYTRITGGALGERAARVIGVERLRDEVREARAADLRRAVIHRPVENDNNPEVTESPYWHTKVQSAWVRNSVERRAEAGW